MTPDDPIIQIRGLHKSFGENHVLRGIDFEVPVGSTVVILGASGSGKSVMMKHMIGLLRPDRGEVIIDGEDITQLPEHEIQRVRTKFGMVFQHAALFDSMTVFENVAFPLNEHEKVSVDETRRRVAEKLESVGLGGTEEMFPPELSGGMRKRVGLARGLILDPAIVLYDEPTTGLDPISTNDVDEMIIDARNAFNVTSVVISHDIASAFKVATRVSVLYDGRIVAEGTQEEVKAHPHPHVQEFLGTWFGKN